MKLRICLIILALALAGCKNTTDEFLTTSVCDRYEYQSSGYFQTIQCGENCSTMMWIDTSGDVCVASHKETYKNPDYIPKHD